MNELTCESWLHGKHSDTIEINTKLPYVAINDFFCQGDDASNVITEINQIYNSSDITPLEACLVWYNLYF